MRKRRNPESSCVYMKKPTIYDIARAVSESSPHFFDRKTLRFFGQTMRAFKVFVRGGRIFIAAPIFDRFTGKRMGETAREFIPEFNAQGNYINRGRLVSVK